MQQLLQIYLLNMAVMAISHDGGIPEDIGIYVYVPIDTYPNASNTFFMLTC
jgi:hypothetical protein